ncbi:hypothetical protein [Paraburkholderia bryophila]|uniref:Integrase n=1 Tax=Paraburkholderia bryophila TaxID=420952 RepID=A0A329CW16_9BURK|nr:hypothetical protein [Paraburkholderia bryophila]RAS38327.1 hypothetical protein BX591_102625 [Paraburkholderia bryophila]
MINPYRQEPVFLQHGKRLHRNVRRALYEAADTLLDKYQLNDIDLAEVTTKAYPMGGFPKFILYKTLAREDVRFGVEYVQNAFDIAMGGTFDVTPEQFYKFTLAPSEGEFAYKRTYAARMKKGACLFLLSLHRQKCIVLPFSFDWPSIGEEGRRLEIGSELCSSLLSFIRTLNSQSDELPHPAFASISNGRKGREYFLSYGTKLLLATGWHRPQDANVEELMELKEKGEHAGNFGVFTAPPYRMLIDVLGKRFGSDFGISVSDWSDKLSDRRQKMVPVEGNVAKKSKGAQYSKIKKSSAFSNVPKRSRPRPLRSAVDPKILERFCGRDDIDVIEEALRMQPIANASLEILEKTTTLPGLNCNIKEFSKTWVILERVFLEKIRTESTGELRRAIGWLNIYLFWYLPYWFERHPEAKFEFPDEPKKLAASVFISRLLSVAESMPLTFFELMDTMRDNREWVNNSYYGTLIQLERFFEFLENNADRLPGCAGFKQPLPREDFPPTSRYANSNKPPIPSILFGTLLSYTEAIQAHLYVILERLLSGELNGAVLRRCIRRRTILDTFELAELFGISIPVLFVNGKAIPLRFIPDCLALSNFRVKVGGKADYCLLPQPHALNQIIVALYTGLRHNHIQWLDVDTFDRLVNVSHGDFTLLYVNTDKTMAGAWTPHVNIEVIEVLRAQRSWRKLIDEPGFNDGIFYNNNQNTKWEKIVPLFSSYRDGRPHNDSRYETVWKSLMAGLHGMLPELGVNGLVKLCELVPPNVGFNNPNIKERRLSYGQFCDDNRATVCELGLATNITPHSSRISVVSQNVQFLPAELIGKAITGQKRTSVFYYTKIEPSFLEDARVHQAMALRKKGFSSGPLGVEGHQRPGSPNFIDAGAVNSRLAESLRENLEETLISYGCMSLTINENGKNGLDVLRETNAANAVENKTEICPFGNVCPPDVIKRWRGIGRCGLCEYAVRSIDHAPAVSAKVHSMQEELDSLTEKLVGAMKTDPPTYSAGELDELEAERLRVGEELAGWKVNEELLYTIYEKVKSGEETRRWIVQKPEIITRQLKRVQSPSNLTSYTLLRLDECVAYPTLDNPVIRARFDILRRTLLALGGRASEAFSMQTCVAPAAECAGLIRTLVEANSLTIESLDAIINGALPESAMPVRLGLVGKGDSHE